MKKYYKSRLKQLFKELHTLRAQVVEDAARRLKPYRDSYPKGQFNKSACNLAYYLALRTHDLRPLQERLAEIGLSSLGRGEAHLMASLEHVIEVVSGLLNEDFTPVSDACPHLAYCEGDKLLARHTHQLLGDPPQGRDTRIMVTLSSEAADDYAGVLALLNAGMNCVRINCAHDDAQLWERMIAHVRRAEKESGRQCKILMDLAGHKIRTGPLARAPAVRHLKPAKDAYGRVSQPCELLLLEEAAPPVGDFDSSRQFHISAELHAGLRVDDRLSLVDAREKTRVLHIVKRNGDGSWLAQLHQSCYLPSGGRLHWQQAEEDGRYRTRGEYALAPFEGKPVSIRLYPQDRLLLSREPEPGRPAQNGPAPDQRTPARIACSTPAIIDDLQVGDPVWIDDGKIGLEVEALSDEGALLAVTHADPDGVRLQDDKGINCPSTRFKLPSLSAKDLEDLAFVCRHADMVGFSFVESLEDMQNLFKALKTHHAAKMPVIAKIETARAVRNLPAILLGSLGRQRLGVMIARGDLSVELGSVRLAEIQEELLWLCEAAHVPVVWATQVLESVAKRGIRSRGEFTDAAMGERAECVMLNKGPFILDAVHALDKVLRSMQEHQHKKFSRMRALHW